MGQPKRFQGIVRSVTLSKDDMRRLLEMPLDEVDEWSPVKVVLLPSREAVARALAESMVATVREHNAQGKPTTFILPVGPTAQYPIAAEISNREGISWRNVWTFNMDDYLEWDNRPIAEEHPVSFRRVMRELLFDRLAGPLRQPESQRFFPDPQDPDAFDRKIEEVTEGKGVDVCFGGIGEHGHVAFNESPDLMTHYAHLTPDEFKQSRTRIMPHQSPETWSRALRHPLYTLFPPSGITVGMNQILGAKRIGLGCQGPVARIAAMHPPTMDYPVTFIQEHPNAKETVVLYVSREV